MEKEKLISKWLDHDLNHQDLEAFKKLEDYDDLIKLNKSLQAFKNEDFNTAIEFDKVLTKLKNTKKRSTHWLKPLMRIAAILAVFLGVYFYTTTIDTTISTQSAQKTVIELPDALHVTLNAKSQLSFNKKKWKNERKVKLNGEAFFKVATGATFSVITEIGTVAVYGTQFNVKQRDQYFEVVCYEGLVGVSYQEKETKLQAGDRFLVMDGNIIHEELDSRFEPAWINNESQFKSLPFKEVLAEFERQYNVTFNVKDIDTNQLFTGSFTHDNLDLALKSIALPLKLTYSKTQKTITLKRE